MMSNGLIAVSLFLASTLLSGVTATDPYTIDSSHTPVTAGMSLRVTVTAASCHPLTVTLYVDGKEITGTITEVPGSVTLEVPAGTQGEGYSLDIECANDRSHESGIVL